MIRVPNSDSQIWKKEQIIFDLIKTIRTHPTAINISISPEGPCARSLGLYSLLDSICEIYNYPKKNVVIDTCNLIEHSNEYSIKITPQLWYLKTSQQHSRNVIKEKTFNTQFRHFGNFIGHGNRERLYIASHLKQYFKDKTYQTYHCNLGNEYHDPFLGVEQMMKYNHSWEDIDSAISLIKQSPLTIDTIRQYPILSPETLNITKIYPDFFVEIVCLTYFTGDTFYLDEKIWRPILAKTPFIVQGPQWFIRRFRELGFKTFQQFWDEGYSDDSSDYQPTAIIDIIKFLANKTLQDLKSMHLDMKEILDHNYNLMMSLQSLNYQNLASTKF